MLPTDSPHLPFYLSYSDPSDQAGTALITTNLWRRSVAGGHRSINPPIPVGEERMSKHLSSLLGALMSAIAAIAMLAPLARASAPSPGYLQFEGCPGSDDQTDRLETKITFRRRIQKGNRQAHPFSGNRITGFVSA